MKRVRRKIASASVCGLCAVLSLGFFSLQSPPTPLSETEQAFVGKWAGERDVYQWEIERFPDRSFEMVFTEPDWEDSSITYSNYAIGVWRVEGDEYYYEWTKWWGDEGDFSGEFMEPVKSVAPNEIVTLCPGEEDPENVEVRVEAFRMKGWELKPAKAK